MRSANDRVAAVQLVAVAIERHETQANARVHRQTLAVHRGRGGAAAEHARGDGHVQLVDEPGLDERPVELASALDQLEVQIQHNLAGIETWTPIEYDLVYTKMDRHCAYDPFLAALCDAVKDQAEAKMRAAGIDVDAVKRGLSEAQPGN